MDIMQSTAKSQAGHSQTLQDSIQYQGRKTARAKSEHRRRQILEAALRIAAREGIRGVKHRSVASEAGVPLASTTYYFKDIEELISDAFMLFAEKAQENLDGFYGTLHSYLDQFDVEQIRESVALRRRFADGLVVMGTRYLMDQIKHRKDEILAEQVFLLEAIRDPELKALARNYRRAWIAGLEEVLARMGALSPEADAALLVSSVMGLGYDGVLYEETFTQDRLHQVLSRLVHVILEIPQASGFGTAGAAGHTDRANESVRQEI